MESGLWRVDSQSLDEETSTNGGETGYLRRIREVFSLSTGKVAGGVQIAELTA